MTKEEVVQLIALRQLIGEVEGLEELEEAVDQILADELAAELLAHGGDDPRVIRLNEVVSRYGYKPGTAIIAKLQDGVPVVGIGLPITHLSGDDGLLTAAAFFPDVDELTDREIAWRIHEKIKSGELHEVSEWSTFDGEHLEEPHPAKAAA